eukprot:TRINITY_DN2955_c0_g1_i1.p1 TRINITY_DN2955_c0_g1~~TRINITY_DN2955_c0_g1_i1.p1  ORF type:complete len:306 (+),score=49.58 TRINITY_DN2955_c0_g1_i1:122-1039(+)
MNVNVGQNNTVEELKDIYFEENNTMVGSLVYQGSAKVYTDFRVQNDGFTTFCIENVKLGNVDLGKLVQRIIDIEQYRMMMLLGLPLAREMNNNILKISDEIVRLIDKMNTIKGIDDEKLLINQLSDLSKDVERIYALTSNRFSATSAYYSIVIKRINTLQEAKIDNVHMLGEYVNRRIGPAISTCENVEKKIENARESLSRVGNLLQTNVNIVLEERNHLQLQSMKTTSEQQFKLQETVEGLSVVAISYYSFSLFKYILVGCYSYNLIPEGIPMDVASAMLVPFVVGFVCLCIRIVKKKLFNKKP